MPQPNSRGGHAAVIYLGTRYSYTTVREMAERFAAALLDLGVAPGERVMLYLPNRIQWVVSWLGIQRAGAVCVPITPIYTPSDLSYIANDSEAAAIICADTNFGYVKRVLTRDRDQTGHRHPDGRSAALVEARVRASFRRHPQGKNRDRKGCLSPSERFSPDTPAAMLPEIAPDGRALAEILYTGGTTKHPKGVPSATISSSSSAEEQIRTSEPLFPVEENVILGNAPLFHILGQTCSLSTLLVGGTLLLQPKINLDATFDSIQRFQVQTMIGVPTLYRMMLEHDRLDQYDLSSVQILVQRRRRAARGSEQAVAGEVRNADLSGLRGHRDLRRGGHVPHRHRQSAQERGPHRGHPKRSASSTRHFLEPVPTGEPGEFIVSSAHMVSAYINKPEETAAAFIELDGRRWYRTADIMSMDEDGNLYFVDRTMDTIKHKGYRVSASEIEAVLQEHPAVVGCCVVGIPDEKVGERIKAYVVLKADIKGITGYDLIKWCRKTLVSYKIPQYIEFRDMLPKSKVGKLLRREIRDEEKRRSES